MSDANSIDADIIARLFQLIEDRSGIFVDQTRREDIAAGLSHQLANNRIGPPDVYVKHLATPEGRDELEKIIERATINETYFFREPNHFRALANHILPGLVRRRRTAVTLWSAGCSTGEEAYSIAMTAHRIQHQLKGVTVRVLGTDVSARAIERARTGTYTRHSFRGVSELDLQTYFIRRPRNFEVKPEIIEMCDFRVMNLLDDTGDRYFEGLDVIFCRNVSIYFREPTIRRLNERLTASLRAGGYLIFGASETLQHQDPRLELVELEGCFVYRKGASPPPLKRRRTTGSVKREKTSGQFLRILVPDALPPVSTPDPQPSSSRTPRQSAEQTEQRFQQALSLIREERFEKATELLQSLADGPRAVDALALAANVSINREDHEGALDLIRKGLTLEPLRADLYLLEGLALRYLDRGREAVDRLKRAIFIDPELYLSRFYLAELYRKLGRSEDAVREYRNALKSFDNPTPVPESLSVLTAGFSRDYLARVCERYTSG